jgi:hypothetical protein
MMPHSAVPRSIDHVVIASRDLAALAEEFRALGFTVGPRNRHPWGTENHIIQFDGSFIELIGVADAGGIPPHAPGVFSFGAHVRDFLADGNGMAMLAMATGNAVGDREAFRKARIGDFSVFDFERSGLNAKGKPVKVAFSLAFAAMPEAPRAAFFTCQQHFPQNFWNEAAQKHANGVRGITSLVMVAEDPSDTHEFLGAFLNQREMRATSFGLELSTGREKIEVLSPEAFRYRFGAAAPAVPGRGPQFAALILDGRANLLPKATSAGSSSRETGGSKPFMIELSGGAGLIGFSG